MPIIDKRVTDKIVLTRTDQLNVTATGSIATIGDAVEGLGEGHIVQVYGSVRSEAGTAIILSDRSSLFITGTIRGSTGGIQIGAMEDGEDIWIGPRGSIAVTHGAAIRGRGKLAVDIGWTVAGEHGEISGGDFGIDFVSGPNTSDNLTVDNRGVINGATGIRSLGSDDEVWNSGTIEGSDGVAVSLGAGKDSYLDAGGRVFGRIDMGAGDDVVSGGRFAETIDGGEDNDVIKAGGGNDFLIAAGGGADQFDGEWGDDTVSYYGSNQGVEVYLANTLANRGAAAGDTYKDVEVVDGTFQADTLEGNDGNNAFWGASGHDALKGHDGNDTLKGGEGNDSLDGGERNDLLAGNEGDDAYTADASDIVTEEAGGGIDTLIATASYSLAVGVEIEILKAEANSGNIALTGNGIGNVLHGNRGSNRIDGRGGNDTLVLTGCRDDYDVTINQDGSVTLADRRQNGEGTDTIHNVEIFHFADTKVSLSGIAAGQAQGLLSGDVVAENSTADVGIGSFLVFAKTGGSLHYELVNDAEGRFAIDASTGMLKVANGVRLDFEQADRHTITVRMTDASGAGTDRTFTILVQDVFNERAFGSVGADVMKGGGGRDYFASLAGNDRIEAGFGNDTLAGGLGKDALMGGGGKDVFVFDTRPNKRSNVDRIDDFNVRDDAVYLDNAVFTKLGSGSDARPKKFKADMVVKGTKAQDAEDRIVYDKKTGSLYYDKDGTGSAAQVKIATLTKNLKMTHSDFFVI